MELTMLVLRRTEGQWLEIMHDSGDRMWIRVYNIRSRFPGQLDLAFDDPDHCFRIERPERPRAKARGLGRRA
jgi:hypothetical protein